MATTPKKRPLTKRQQKALAAHVGGLSQIKAAKLAGYTDEYAETCRVFQLPRVKSALTDALEKRYPDIIHRIATRYGEQLDAELSVVVGRGREREVVRVPDYDNRFKAIALGFRTYGEMPIKMEVPPPARPPIAIHFHLRDGRAPRKPTSVVDGKPGAAPITMTQKKPFKFTFTAQGRPASNGSADDPDGGARR